MVCDMWYFEREMREEFRNNIKIIPDYPKHVVVEIWFNPLQINLGLKQLFCCSHRRPIYDVAFHFKDVPLSLPRNKTIILISGCMACSAVFLCFLWDTNSLRDNLQTAADVKNKRGSSLFVPLYLFNWFVQHKFWGTFDFSRKSELISGVSPFPCIGTFVFYTMACKEFVLVHSFIAKGTPFLPPGEKLI